MMSKKTDVDKIRKELGRRLEPRRKRSLGESKVYCGKTIPEKQLFSLALDSRINKSQYVYTMCFMFFFISLCLPLKELPNFKFHQAYNPS